jgi:ATP-dependent DNA helicase RecG
MIKISDGDYYERMRSLIQDLTFEQARLVYKEKGIPFEKEHFIRLGIIEETGLYTNLGLLLSDQCMHTIKVAVFSDEAKTTFNSAKEFSGSVLTQLEDTYTYLMLCNQNRFQIDDLSRREYWDYPKQALREALLNAIIHRDYAYSGSIIITITKKHIEFVSIGGLVGGLTTMDIMAGISQPRNRLLADIFHRLGYVEAYGTGLRRIRELYTHMAAHEQIEVTPNTFKIVLPNQNESQPVEASAKEPIPLYSSKQFKQILEEIQRVGYVTDESAQTLLGVKKTRAYLILRQMIDASLIKKQGRGKTKRYVLKRILINR